MSQPWIKMRMALSRCPQVVRIACGPISAGLPDDCPFAVRKHIVVGALHATWSLADEHSEDGNLPGYVPEALDHHVGIPGWSETLEAVGWLVVTPEGLSIPDFEQHNGASARRRAQEAARKRRERTRPRVGSSRSECPQSMRTDSPEPCVPEERRGEEILPSEGDGPRSDRRPPHVEEADWQVALEAVVKHGSRNPTLGPQSHLLPDAAQLGLYAVWIAPPLDAVIAAKDPERARRKQARDGVSRTKAVARTCEWLDDVARRGLDAKNPVAYIRAALRKGPSSKGGAA